jgi:predicted dienelactone hydrolase
VQIIGAFISTKLESMKTFIAKRCSMVASLVLAGTCAHAAGFQHGFAADPHGKPIELGIWYPSSAAPQPQAMGPTTMNVAINGPVLGKDLPLILISHGTGGSFLGHFDTAIALADAGFVVAAITHTGDNYADKSRSVDIMDRPRQISRVITHILAGWEGRAAVNPERVGMYGFSAGGFTTLASIGAVPDFSTVTPMCREYPGDFACQLLAKSGNAVTVPAASAIASAADIRIKAAVVAAPALGFTFAPDGLKNVKAPVQLWRAEEDAVLPHPRYAEAVRLALPQTPEYHVVSNAGHFDFLAPCSSALASIAPAICASAPGFDRVEFHRRFNTAVIDFFTKTLKAF